MSENDSRAERRRKARGIIEAPQKAHDPMRPVYIGFGVLIALVLIAFFALTQWQNRKLAAAIATPTPGPNATAKAIQLTDGEALGKAAFAPGDTPDGGNGNPVDGIKCQATEQVALHIHAHLALYDHGVQREVPRFIGFASKSNCLYWLHTHDPSGIIHVESPEFRDFTLGNFFHIWGEPLTSSQVAGFKGPITAYINGSKYTGALSDIPLTAHQLITLEVGAPTVPPPNYTFPEGD
ncbi:MAG: hypothetical protein M3Y21_06065 [Candidatus Eremiobacteraeota bacterium]|nr:hypothetical protein [Candidatus Eremiobacteraeota bacterium]